MGEDSFAQPIELITNVWHVIVNNTYKNDFNNTFRLWIVDTMCFILVKYHY